jgi:S1-C subfamily serine protease
MEDMPAMRNVRFFVFGLVLTGLVAAAVSGLVAQAQSEPQRLQVRPRALMLDGRGGQLGVVVEDLDTAGLKDLAGATSGVRIEDVDQDGPAAKAGLRDGDIVVDVDGDRVRSARQFARLIQETPEGRSVALGIVRDGKRQTVNVTPESGSFTFSFDADRFGRDVARSFRDLEPKLREIEPRLKELEPHLRELEPRMREFHFDAPFSFDMDMLPRMTSPRGRLGVQLDELSPQLAEYFGAASGGVLVSGVTRDSAAEKAGIKAGDVITSINGDRVRDTDDLIDELRSVEGGEVTIGIVRDKKETSVKATIENQRPARRPGRPI